MIISGISGKDHFEVVYRIADEGGEWRWLKNRGVAQKDDRGNTERLSGSIEDITQQKNLEEEILQREAGLREILEASPYPIIVTRPPEGKILFRNRSCIELFETTGDDQDAVVVSDFLADPDEVEEIRKNVLELGRDVREMKVKSQKGRDFRAEVSVTLINFEGGPAVNTVIKDIEEARQYQERIQQESRTVNEQASKLSALTKDLDAALQTAEAARLEAEDASRAKSEFLAMMSHEIRTPMNGVLGTAQLIKRDELSDRNRQLIDVIVNSGNTLLHIIDDILDYAKLDSGKMVFEKRPVDPRKTVKAVMDLLRPKADEKGLELSATLIGDFPEALMLDEHRLQQVLLNLVGNALKFTSEGEVGIILKLEEADETEETCDLHVRVCDTGPGIDKDARDILFSRFTQADQSISRQFGGTGLGLAICKQILDNLNGEIGVDSEPGKGSQFWFHLPDLEVAEAPQDLSQTRGQLL